MVPNQSRSIVPVALALGSARRGTGGYHAPRFECALQYPIRFFHKSYIVLYSGCSFL